MVDLFTQASILKKKKEITIMEGVDFLQLL